MKRKIKLLWLLAESCLPSRLRIALLRMRGAEIGSGVRIGWRAVLECGGIVLGDRCVIGAGVRVRVRGNFTLGEGVQIGVQTKIGAAEVTLGDETIVCSDVRVEGFSRFARLTTGRRCYIGDRCYLDLSHGVTLGEEVGIAGATMIFTHGSWQSELEGFPIANGTVKVGDYGWIGCCATILAGAQIGEFATVGAGTVLRGKVPSCALAMGNPGKVIFTDGKHMMPVREAERFDICREIIKDAAAHLEWLGNRTTVTEAAGECRVSIDGSAVLLKPAITSAEGAQAVISIQRISDDVILRLEAEGCDWFDIARRRCSRPACALNVIIRSFFSSHGVRFRPVDRGAIATAADGKTAIKPRSVAAA